MASQRLLARKSVMICSLVRISPKSIARSRSVGAFRLKCLSISRQNCTFEPSESTEARSPGRLNPPHKSHRTSNPPLQSRQWFQLSAQQRDGNQQHTRIAEEDDHSRKEVSLVGDVRLRALQNVPRQSDVKAVAGAEQQMEPHRVCIPVPDPVPSPIHKDHEYRVERKKVRS